MSFFSVLTCSLNYFNDDKENDLTTNCEYHRRHEGTT